MGAVWLLARRNLGASRARLAASVGGVGLALTLTLALDAIFAGVAGQLTVYIDRAGADVWVAQRGVRNLHMVASAMPQGTAALVATVPGVAEVTPILEATDTITAGDERAVAYLVGLPQGTGMGRAWDVAAGTGMPGAGEVVVDEGFARRAGIGLGADVTTLGRTFRVAGLSRGTASLVNSVAFVPFEDFRAARRSAPLVSYLLVREAPGTTADALAASIERRVTGVTALSAADFASEERRLVMDMSADVIAIMDSIGFIVALAVLGLTVCVATVARRAEYGALKAIGARNGFLYRVVAAQALLMVGLGLTSGLLVTVVLGTVVPLTGLDLRLVITGESLTKGGLVALAVGVLAALIPISTIAGLDPAAVYRRGASQ
jgi:putative ABC transport system permease protein